MLFMNCNFHCTATNTEFISANNAVLGMCFTSNLFYKVSASGHYCMIHFCNAVEGILDRFYFAEISSFLGVYTTGVALSCGLLKAFLNSSAVVKYQEGEALHCGGYEEYTSFLNNNSHLTTASIRSCYWSYPAIFTLILVVVFSKYLTLLTTRSPVSVSDYSTRALRL